jgi:predicted RNase H-like HicB family nuclease
MTMSNKRKMQAMDAAAMVIAKIVSSVEPESPHCEYALQRLAEAQYWAEKAIEHAEKQAEKQPETRLDLDTAGYHYRAAHSDKNGCFVARVAEFPSMGAHGDTAKEAIAELQNAVGLAVVDMLEQNEQPPKPVTDEQAHEILCPGKEPGADG